MFDCTCLPGDDALNRSNSMDGMCARHRADAGLDVLRRAITRDFSGRIAVVSSFGAESAVLLALVADLDRATPVLFVQTGQHFAETLAYRDALTAYLGLRDVRSVGPTDTEQAAHDPGAELWR